MRAYSIDLRERIVGAAASGQPLTTTARRFAVSVKTVQLLVRQQRETGTLDPRPIPGMPRRIGPAEERHRHARMQAVPDATVLENCAWWAEVHLLVLSTLLVSLYCRVIPKYDKKRIGSASATQRIT